MKLILFSVLVPPLLLAQNDQHHALLPIIHLSPQCWIHALQDATTTRTSFGTSLCVAMSPEQEKILALEMARCHLAEAGRTLFYHTLHKYNDGDDDSDHDELCASPISILQLPSCLLQLSDTGLHSYTHFFTHVHQACVRLTSDLAIQYQQSVAIQLAQTSQGAVESFQAIVQQQEIMVKKDQQREAHALEYQQQFMENMNQQADSLKLQTLDLNMYRTKFDSTMMESRQQVQAAMVMYQEFVQLQTSLLQDRMNQVIQSVEWRETEKEMQMNQWVTFQQELLQSQSLELEHQHKRMAELHQLASVVSTMMQPVLSIQYMIGLMTQTVSIMSHLPFSLVMCLFVYMLTIPKRSSCGRQSLMMVVFVELVLELLFAEVTTTLRFWSKGAVAVVYLYHWFHPPTSVSNQETVYFQQTMMDWRNEMETLKKQQAVVMSQVHKPYIPQEPQIVPVMMQQMCQPTSIEISALLQQQQKQQQKQNVALVSANKQSMTCLCDLPSLGKIPPFILPSESPGICHNKKRVLDEMEEYDRFSPCKKKQCVE